jgi:hypothetical protein
MTRQRLGIAVFCGLVSLVGPSCRVPFNRVASSPTVMTSPRVLVATAWRHCGERDGEFDANLQSSIAAELPKILAALQKATGAKPVVLSAATSSEVHAALAVKAPVPIVFTFIGHGNLDKETGRSTLCFDDGAKEVDSLLADISSEVSHAVWILDACYSGNVDVRKSTVPVSVISASPDNVEPTKPGGTALGEILALALDRADRNQDGVTTDRELLRALVQLSGTTVAGHARPILRRQSWIDLTIGTPHAGSIEATAILDTLLSTWKNAGPTIASREQKVRSGKAGQLARSPSTLWYIEADPSEPVQWPEGAPTTRDRSLAEALADRLMATRVLHVLPVPPYVHIYELPQDEFAGRFRASESIAAIKNLEAGHAAWLSDDDRPTVYHPGWVEENVVTMQGECLPAQRLAAQPCPAKGSTRQCFAVAETMSGGVK